VTSGDAVTLDLTLAFVVVACRLLLAGGKGFAAYSPLANEYFASSA
jgi:hypothetical protein